MVSLVPPPLVAPAEVLASDSDDGAAAAVDELLEPPPTELHPAATKVTIAATAVRPTARVFLMDNPPRDGIHTLPVGHPVGRPAKGALCVTFVSDPSTLRAVVCTGRADWPNRDRRLTTGRSEWS
jgi:hypothetical protein